MSTVHLLLPFCDSQSKIEEVKKVGVFSSATMHALTALVLAIIVGAGAALAAYFLTQGILMWSALAGGGGALFTALASYVILRCALGQHSLVQGTSDQQTEDNKLKLLGKSKKGTTTPEDNDELDGSDKGKLKKEGKDGLPLDFSPSNRDSPVYITGVAYSVKKTIPLHYDSLLELLDEIKDKNFTAEMKKQGVVFYDPANELPIPFVRLYQELLTHPDLAANEDKRVIIYSLFAEELLALCQKEGTHLINIYVEFLNPDVVNELAKYIPISDLTAFQLEGFLRNYGKAGTFQEIAANQQEITRQLKERVGEYSIGASLGDGGCLFHTLARQLSRALGQNITEKTLRMQCYAYMQKIGEVECRLEPSTDPMEDGKATLVPWTANSLQSTTGVELKDYEKEALEVSWSSRDILDPAITDKNKPGAPSWGESGIHGAIIAELYGVTLKLYEPVIVEEDVPIYDYDYDYDSEDDEEIEFTHHKRTLCESDGITIKPYTEEGRITLADLGYDPVWETGATLHIGSMSRHFFPIWDRRAE